jgi:hypothetical protein
VYKNNGFNRTKQGLLQSKTMGFTTQNNGFCKIKQWVLQNRTRVPAKDNNYKD